MSWWECLESIIGMLTIRTGTLQASLYPGSLIIAGEEKRAWFQSLTHAPIAPPYYSNLPFNV